MRALERQIESSVDALKLLYLIVTPGGPAVWMMKSISKTTTIRRRSGRRWIRMLPVLVLIYEGCARSHVYVRLRAAVDAGFGACSRHLNVCRRRKDDADDLPAHATPLQG